MANFTSYEAVGVKEDISDIITNISPTKTPFLTGIGREKITQKFFQWQEDSLRAQALNAQTEGFTATSITVVPTVMRNNYTQIFAETVAVSGTMDATSTYGRARESAYQMAKSAAAVKRDLEYSLVGSQQTAVAGNDTGPLARQMAGYQSQVDATQVTYTGAGPAPLDEPHILTALQNAYIAGAEPNTVMVTPSDAVIVAGFAKASGRYRTIVDANGSAGKMVNAVDIYVSPFGQVKVVLNRWQHTGDTLVYEPGMWSLATLRSWFREVLAKTGDSLQQMIVGEFSLKHKNYKASALVVQGTSGL